MWSAVIQAVLTGLIKFLEFKANEQKTIQDVNTPLATRVRWAAYLRTKLRNPDSGDQQPK